MLLVKFLSVKVSSGFCCEVLVGVIFSSLSVVNRCVVCLVFVLFINCGLDGNCCRWMLLFFLLVWEMFSCMLLL